MLGRQPAIGLAELESLFSAPLVQPAGRQAAILDLPHDQVDFDRLGSVIKFGQLLTTLDSTSWPAIENYLRQHIQAIMADTPEGKIKLGISQYGFEVTGAKLGALGLTLKKHLRSDGRSVRVVPNKEAELSSAQVYHNGLASATGCELLVVRDGQRTHIGRTTKVQDINAYAARDQGRPKRDARVGMLPPKLAQTIINLAAGTDPAKGQLLLDPFCGTGVVLQEAALMGYNTYGTDLEQRMIDFSARNLAWLAEQFPDLALPEPKLETGDATAHRWQPVPALIAAETYLGQPFTTVPTPEKLEQVRSACNTIHRKFLQNLASQIPSGTRLCLAVPAWQTRAGHFVHLSTLDHLEELGYNRMSFKHVETSKDRNDLVYARADQIVARELLVITKN